MTCPTARAIIIHHTLSTADWAEIYSLGNIARTGAPLDDARSHERLQSLSERTARFQTQQEGACLSPAFPEVVG